MTFPNVPAFSSTQGVALNDLRLGLYNTALRYCGQTRLSTLNDNVEARRLLDDAWQNGAVQDVLESGLWYFARRTSRLTADPTITPNFGFSQVCELPHDWVKTMAVCSDESFNVPLLQMSEESGFIFSDLNQIYVAYVSNDAEFGNNWSLWPQSFYNAVAAHIADIICFSLTKDKGIAAGVEKRAKQILINAKSDAAMNGPAKFLPMSSWIRARSGDGSGWDRGNRNSLYG